MIIKSVDQPILTNGLYPDMFVSEEKKRSKDYVKTLADYFYSQAVSQYKENCKTFVQNYRFVKGELRREDFYDVGDEAADFIIGDLTRDEGLPNYVQQYSILSQPINTLWGEQSAKPDNTFVKAFDDDSRSEVLQFKTDMLNQYISQVVREKVLQKAVQQGLDLQDEEVQLQIQQMTSKEISENIASYTTQGEKWGNHVLRALKMEFNIKEHSEEAYRDLLICGRPRFHVYEDKSKTGFKAESVNPKNVWISTSPDKKYTRDAYAAGIIEVMEISEIIEKFELSKEEVDELRKEIETIYGNTAPESNLFRNRTGIASIDYNAVNPMREQEQMIMESELMRENSDDLFLNQGGSGLLGQRHIVLTAYHLSKKKIGLLTYIDIEGVEQSTIVDETYKNNSHPNQLSLVWGYVNQWWKTVRLGCNVYISEPFNLLEYCPIIGLDFENRNVSAKSLVDLMKSYQIIFNLCMNQLWELLQKEKGVLYEFNPRKIPVGKDESFEDAIMNWLEQAKELGFIFSDDSPENMQAPTSNTNTSKPVDLTRGAEMQSRLAIAERIKMECHSLVGLNPERMGGVAATQTATGTQAALTSSFSQTKAWETAHDYLLNQLYQAILDAAQYIESNKETSTISYITNEGENAFIKVNGSDLKLRDLRVFITSRMEDSRMLEDIRSLSQAMLQNGTDPYTVAKMRISNSLRDIQDELRKDKEKRDQMVQQQQQAQQQQLEQQQAQFDAQLQQQSQEKQAAIENDNYNKQLDRISKERVALINSAGRDKTILDDANGDGTADALALSNMDLQIQTANRQHEIASAKLANEASQQQSKISQDKVKGDRDYELKIKELDLKEKEIEQKRKDSENKLKIAKANKNSFDGPSKSTKK